MERWSVAGELKKTEKKTYLYLYVSPWNKWYLSSKETDSRLKSPAHAVSAAVTPVRTINACSGLQCAAMSDMVFMTPCDQNRLFFNTEEA